MKMKWLRYDCIMKEQINRVMKWKKKLYFVPSNVNIKPEKLSQPIKVILLTQYLLFSIVLKPGPARQVDLRLEPGWVEKKIREEKIRLTRQDLVKNSVTTRWFLFFLLNDVILIFKKNWPRRSGQNSEPGPYTGRVWKLWYLGCLLLSWVIFFKSFFN
jgi:hypothetical protein